MTVPSTVELIVKITNAVNPLRQVKKEADKTNESFKKTEDVLRRVTAASNKVKLSVQEQQKSLPKLSQVQGVLAAKVRNSEQAMRSQIKALRDLQVRVRFNGTLYNKLGAEIDKFETKLKSANNTTRQATERNRGLAGGLGKLVVAFGLARAAQATLQAGIRRDDSERRLRLLTERFGETAEAQAIAQRAADKFNLSQTEANVQLSRLIARLRPMGLSMQTIETAFAGFNTATILAGATASESAGAFLQLSQALGSGVLRGQELNSILEQAPLIAQAIATEMGSTVGALKKFGEEGQITSEIVIAALGRVEREGAGQLEAALEGPSAKIKAFQNAVQDAQVAISESSVPAIADSMKELGTVIRQLEPAIKFIGELLAGVAKTVGNIVENISTGGALAAAQKAANEAATLQTREKFGFNIFSQEAQTFRAEVLERELARRVAIVRGAVPGQLPPSAATLPSDKPDTGGRFRSTELSDEEKKRLDKIKQQNILAKTKFFQAQEELAVLLETNEVEKIRLDFAAKRANVQRDYASLIANAKSDEERLNHLGALRTKLQVLSLEQNVAITDEIEKRTETFSDQLAQQDEFRHAIAEQNNAYVQLNETFRTGIVDGILAAVEGTKSLSDSLLGVIKQMARLILQQQLLNALSGLNFFGGGGGGGTYNISSAATPKTLGMSFFANGGRPPVGRPSVVGERGPELFVPDRAGTIIPNGGFGGANVVVNVDASGSSVQGDEGSSRQLGALIGAAVQGEIIKQQRPGGLLSR